MDEPSVAEPELRVSKEAPAVRTKRCACGHDRDHPMVSASGEYTFMGWVLILIGISATPIAIRYACRRCGQTLGRTSDPSIIEQTQLWG